MTYYGLFPNSIIRSTLTAMPESANLLSKCRLPLGILIHPFKDLEVINEL
jgi:hypothetical protein